MRTLLQDIRYGARMARRQPTFSLVIVMTLALAIGANTVIFSFSNVLLLRPLPVRDQDSLGWLFAIDPQRGGTRGPLSIPEFLDYRKSLTTFEGLAASVRGSVTLTGRGEAQRLVASRVTANLIEVWGLRVIAGRGFSPDADRPGAPREVVLSHHYWRQHLASNPSVLGGKMVLDGQPATVTGVLAPEIEIGNLSEVDVWVPLELSPDASRLDRTLRVFGRMKPGVTIAQATTDVRQTAMRLAREYPASNEGWSMRVAPTREAMTGAGTWIVLALLSLVVGFVLLIACANLANLVLARATGRRRELAVRSALGAGRGRMVRQMLTENMLYGALGGLAGLAVADAGLSIIKAAAYEPFFALVHIDRNVMVFTALLALVTPMLFGILPALQSSRTDINEALKDTGTRTAGGHATGRSRSVLVVAQLGLAVMLLVLATLLLQALIALSNTPLGFDPTRLVSFQLDLPSWRYTNDAATTDYYDRLLARLQSTPGVARAAVTNRLPLLGSEATTPVSIEGRAISRPEDRPWAIPVVVSEDFFATVGIQMVAGRAFTTHDEPGRPPVVVVNTEMARRHWGSPTRAVGARIATGGGSGWLQIVGVVSDVRRADREAFNPQIYLAARQQPRRTMSVLVRADDPDAALGLVRSQVTALDRDVPISDMRPMQQALDEDLSSSRVLGGLFVAFALVALILAASGLYAVVSYSASQRTQEIGVRVALGAAPGDIRRMMLRQTAIQVAIGVTIGLLGGRALAVGASTLLFQVSPSDPATYAGVALTLGAVALLASYAPVRRAMRVDPVVALRLE